jgi:hypothetical protein
MILAGFLFLFITYVSTAFASSPKKIFCVQSYEKGVGCGARIEAGMVKTLKDLGYEEGKDINLFHFYRLSHIKFHKAGGRRLYCNTPTTDNAVKLNM